MEQRFLGRTGMKVSEVCLGAMTFGREADEATSHRMLDVFAERGGTFIDTADVYGPGTSEEVTGRWLAKQDRERFVVATKVRFPSGPGPNDVGLSRKHILASIEASLRRLGTDYVDLYQVHCWDAGTALEETLTTLATLVERGKVRYLGASNHTGWQLAKAVETSRRLGIEAYASLQPQYNLLARPVEWELIPLCRAEGLAVLPWGPLRGGWLSGRYSRDMGGAPEGSRVDTASRMGWSETWAAYDNDHTWAVVDALRAVADKHGKHPAQVAIRWVAQRPGVTAPILGASRLDQLEVNLGALGWHLPEDDVAALTAVSEVRGDYPYDDMIENAQRGRSVRDL